MAATGPSYTPTGTAYTSQPKTFAAGTYTYFPCVYDGSWHNVGTSKQFTVDSPSGGTTVTVTRVTDDAVTIAWAAVSGATGYRVGRDGTDTGGAGPWETIDPASTTSRGFLHLRTGVEYTFFVEPQPDGRRVEVRATPGGGSPSPTPTPSPTTTPPPRR